MPRIVKDPEERRQELLDAAEKLFGTKGYAKTAVSDIVKEVGVSQGTFYYYFKSKDEIADAVIDRAIDQGLAVFKKIAHDDSLPAYRKALLMIAHDLYGFDHEQSMGSLFPHIHHEENAFLHQKMMIRSIKAFAPIFGQIVEQGKREGSFRTDKDALLAAEFLVTGYQFWLDASVFQWNREELRLRRAAIGGFIETVLGAEPGSFDLSLLKNEYEKFRQTGSWASMASRSAD
jgi:AcrR family transcriptional regulator